MKILPFFIISSIVGLAQTIVPTVSTSTVVAGKPVTITLTYTTGSTPAAAIQWASSLPPGSSIVWSTSLSKTLKCSADGTSCVLYNLSQTAIASGIIATGTLNTSSSVHAALTFTITSDLGAAGPGFPSIPMSGGAIGFTSTSPFDLSGDGLVNSSDLDLAARQVVGLDPCTTADFNNDGVCNVIDLQLLVVDAASSNP